MRTASHQLLDRRAGRLNAALRAGLSLGLGLAFVLAATGCPGDRPASTRDSGTAPGKSAARTSQADRPAGTGESGKLELYEKYAGSASCRPCHEEAFEKWQDSHHALAERPLDLGRPDDRAAFEPPKEIRHGSMESTATIADGKPQLVTQAIGGERAFEPERVFGVDPLRQFLVPGAGGRLQATELAWDPNEKEWFDVYGDEDRRPGEWGHWTGRGMNWNSMCAGCHNTRLLKRYDPETDTYDTRMAEMGVGCESCHGPAADHVAWQEEHGETAAPGSDPTAPKMTRDEYFEGCGPCHSRRSELTGDYIPGEPYLDHYLPVMTDDTDIYYPDGQVREENYEFVSFLSSVMHGEGVRCMDCHDPHSGKVKFQGNALCLQCHQGKVDPLEHGHHELGTPGSFCYDCHMPLTTYMQRHERRDHGFTIPDPALTREHGVPNACNRCHEDQSVAWAEKWVKEWYGDKPARYTQQRARWVARARTGDGAVVEPLLKVAREDTSPHWRATATSLLRPWLEQERVQETLVDATRDESALVRSTAVRQLEPLVAYEVGESTAATRRLLDDPLRAVRVGAAWNLRAQLDPLSRPGRDLRRSLQINLDQPSGLLQQGVWLRGRYPKEALPYFERAVRWDEYSPVLRYEYAVTLSQVGRPAAALAQMEKACELAPENAQFHFSRGLALGELDRVREAASAFERAVAIEPRFTRAWHNLGQARLQLNELDAALDAARQARDLDPDNPDSIYWEAYVLLKMGRTGEAHATAKQATEIAPEHTGARHLLTIIEDGLEFEG